MNILYSMSICLCLGHEMLHFALHFVALHPGRVRGRHHEAAEAAAAPAAIGTQERGMDGGQAAQCPHLGAVEQRADGHAVRVTSDKGANRHVLPPAQGGEGAVYPAARPEAQLL
jgi:hypothetical protein